MENSMESRHKGLKEIIIAILIIFGCFFAVRWHMETHQNKQNTFYYQTQIQRINHKNKRYTKQTVIHELQKKEPNLPLVENNARNTLNKGIGIAYNHCQNNNAFYKNQNQIKDLLGTSLGNQVISNVRPYSGTVSSTPISLSQHETGIQIGFGKYNPDNQTIELDIVVHFKSPKNANITVNKNSAHRKSYNYFTTYQISYKPKNKQNPYIVEHYDCGINSNMPYPQNY